MMDKQTVPQPGILPEKPALSVCMIVLDEEKALPRCLNSVQSIADELILVDTGSKDNTVSIAREFGAKIVHFEWRDDFSAARNESLRHATSDWILQMDADEELLYSSIPYVKMNMHRSTVLQYVTLCDNGPTCPTRRFVWIDRFFRNHPNLRYERPYHESVYSSVENLIRTEPRWQVEYDSNIMIRHYGYEQAEIQRKCERGLTVMTSYAKAHPNDDYILSKLAGAHYLLERYDEAEAYFRKALEIDPNVSEINFDLAMTLQKQKKLDEAIRYFKKAIAGDRNLVVAYVNLGAVYLQKGMVDDAISELKSALGMSPNLIQAYSHLGEAYRMKGMVDESIAQFKRVLSMEAGDSKAHSNLAIAYCKKGDYREAIKYCDRAMELGATIDQDLLELLESYR